MAEQMKHTKFEKARMIGSRALQIGMGAPFLVKLEKADLEKISYNPIEIAKLEFEKGVIPMSIRRPTAIRNHEPQAS
jgi:DNA-directed RNA polymerase subunit K